MNLNRTRFNGPTLGTANQYCHVIDSTRGFARTPANSASLVATFGDNRGRWAGARLEGSINCVTQNVTFVRQIRSGAAGAWETVANTTEINGSQTITAGTTYPFRWVPSNPDFRAYILIGGTAPDSLDCEFMLILDDRAAVS